MPTMFPAMASNSDDPNRTAAAWKPGDPAPRAVVAAFAILLVVAVLMIVSGLFLLTARWDRAPQDQAEAEAMDFVLRNTRILGGINLVVASVIALCVRGLRDGNAKKRRYTLWAGALGMFFTLAGWVLGFTGAGQAMLALGLAIALLLAYRPSANSYFDATARHPAPEESVGDPR